MSITFCGQDSSAEHRENLWHAKKVCLWYNERVLLVGLEYPNPNPKVSSPRAGSCSLGVGACSTQVGACSPQGRMGSLMLL